MWDNLIFFISEAICLKLAVFYQHKNIYKPMNYKDFMNKWLELLVGLLLIIIPIIVAFYSQTWGAWNFWSAAGTFFKGGLFWFIVMIGVLFVLLGISDLKESTSSPQRAQAPQPMAEEKPARKRRKR